MLRKCHLNALLSRYRHAGPALRARFHGDPQHVINYFRFVAQQLREIMAQLGLRTINEMVAASTCSSQTTAVNQWKGSGLDLSALLFKPEVDAAVGTYCSQSQDHGLERALDHQLIAKAQSAIEQRTPVAFEIPIRNRNRAVGATLSWEISKRYGDDGLPPDTIRTHLRGSAGQSFGAFLAKGVQFTLEGDANDYLGKGLSGGRLIVRPPDAATFVPEDNIIIGNVALYGATAGEAFVQGMAGERFAVRNSGVRAVVEGVGDHGCEYMTGGRVAVLGPTGRNFAAGMSGGIAYVLDEAGDFSIRHNPEMSALERLEEQPDIDELRAMIERHIEFTGSQHGQRVLNNFDALIPKFVKIMPHAYKRVLDEMAAAAAAAPITDASEPVAATES